MWAAFQHDFFGELHIKLQRQQTFICMKGIRRLENIGVIREVYFSNATEEPDFPSGCIQSFETSHLLPEAN